MHFLSASLAAVVLLAGCASSPEPTLVVPLSAARGNEGSLARATLIPDAVGTRIELFFTAAGPQPTLPLHVYTYLYEGRCDALPERAVYSLNDRVLVRTQDGNVADGRRGAFLLSHEVALPLPELVGGRYALALRAAPQDGGQLLYCGALRQA